VRASWGLSEGCPCKPYILPMSEFSWALASSLLRALRLALKWAQCGLVFNKLITILEKSQRLIMQKLY